MKRLITSCFYCILIIYGCDTPQTKKIEIENNQKIDGFILKGTLKNYLADKVYLNKIIENTLYPIDSAVIKNNQFIFNGVVSYPERFSLTFENYSASLVLILENTNFEVEIDPNFIQEPVIKGSPLNSKLNEYKQHSKKIFSEMELLFPKFQKARLENNAVKLAEIGAELEIIEATFRNYSYEFIKTNSESYVAPMVLRDQLKATNMDTLRIKESYNLLSDKVKNSPDSQIIAFNIN